MGEDANLTYDGTAANSTANAAQASAQLKRLALISRSALFVVGHAVTAVESVMIRPMSLTCQPPGNAPGDVTQDPVLPLVLTVDTNRD